MDKYKKYFGVLIFLVAAIGSVLLAYYFIAPRFDSLNVSVSDLESTQKKLENKKAEQLRVSKKLQQLKDSVASSQKKVYSPLESDLGNDTLFFTLYNDLLEMVHANSVKIRTLDYSYNPASDKFVQYGKDIYFVSDVEMELVSNYVNIGKLIQDIYQYPYYIRINELSVKPYEKDKKILIANLSLRLYAHTAPIDEMTGEAEDGNDSDELQ